jgi:hypothetical protein
MAMDHEALLSDDWQGIVERLGGAEALRASARETKAFLRPRVIGSAEELLRLVLAYCLGERGLRLTCAWAAASGLADLSNVGLLGRLRQCGDWLALLVGHVLNGYAPTASKGRLIRLIDATNVPQAGAAARKKNRVWRVHSAFDLPAERFGHFELTDQRGAERLDRVPVVAGEIRIADRVHLHPERMAAVLAQGADVVVRAGWKSARWLDEDGEAVDLPALLRQSETAGRIDRPIRLARKGQAPLGLRLVALRKSPQAAEAAKRKARRAAQRGGHQISKDTLSAAEWVLLVTSLDAQSFSTDDVLDLYRLRWRIELGFKRLKSVIGLKAPPGKDERSARPWVLAHLLMILLLEPLVDAFEDSPRWATSA